MVFKNFRFVCSVRVLLLCALALVLFMFGFRTSQWVVGVLAGVLIIHQTVSLIRYVEKTNRDLSRFVEAIKYEDVSRSFKDDGRGGSFDELSRAFSDVAKEIQQARSEKEEQYQYLQTVIQHVGVGLIAYQQNGDIQLVNTAAKKLMGVPYIKNIKTLQSVSGPLVELLLRLRSGESALVNVDTHDGRMQLALNATKFIMQGTKFTLASIQNIKSELERERMAKELEIAHQVQMSLLPKGSPDVPGFDIAGLCIPAKEVGGDYYDFIHLGDGKIGIAVGDVSGKGVPAAIYMTLTKGVIQSQASEQHSPGEVLKKINALLYQSIERRAFVSMFYTVLDTKRRTLVCSRAGHNPAFYFRGGDTDCAMIRPRGIALGLEKGELFSNVIKEEEIRLKRGDLLVFHTDGFTEAMDSDHEEYGERRLLDVIRKNKDKDSMALIESVSKDVRQFTQLHPQHDDMTMVSVKVK